jgi:ferredoxin-NADP reductase
MKEHIVKIISEEFVTYDVKRFVVTKPVNYTFVPGQATEVSINSLEWKDQKRPFTFTSLNEDENLEFIIKIYNDHKGVTNALGKLKSGDELLIHDVWGVLNYKGEGIFIAGGAGITPFISILRQLYKENKLNNNKLIFSNKTSADIILKGKLEDMLGNNFINKLTSEGEKNKHIDKDFLKEHIQNFKQYFYVCGPEPFMTSIQNYLIDLGAEVDSVVFEK